MGEKGSNSLYNITKENEAVRDSRLKLYYFPEITLENSVCVGGGMVKEKDFHLSNFDDNGGPSPELHERIEELTPDIIEEMQDKALAIEEQAYIKGFAKGERAGLEVGRKKMEPVLDNFCQALKELNRITESICQDAEKEVVDLALAIARKVVGLEVSTNRDVVIRVVREALKNVSDHGKIKIRLGPSDFKFIMQDDRRVQEFSDGLERITFIEDPTIGQGGCVIESTLGDVDARIERQLQIIEEAFKSECKGIGPENLEAER